MNKPESYYKIYEQIYENPWISLYDIAVNTKLSRNTVSKYLKEMYSQSIIVGPHLYVNPSTNCKEHVYLLNFDSPLDSYEELKQHPHVIYHGVTCGDWNTVVITDKFLDFSQFTGFETIVHRGIKGFSYTPKVVNTTWREGFETANTLIGDFTPGHRDPCNPPHFLPWGKDEWTLFSAFKDDLRKKVIPTLKDINIRYDIYTKWLKTVKTNCTILTRYYPQGYLEYMSHLVLVSSDYRAAVTEVLESFPAPSVITETDDSLLVSFNTPSPAITRNLFCTLYDMKVKTMIKKFKKAVALFFDEH